MIPPSPAVTKQQLDTWCLQPPRDMSPLSWATGGSTAGPEDTEDGKSNTGTAGTIAETSQLVDACDTASTVDGLDAHGSGRKLFRMGEDGGAPGYATSRSKKGPSLLSARRNLAHLEKENDCKEWSSPRRSSPRLSKDVMCSKSMLKVAHRVRELPPSPSPASAAIYNGVEVVCGNLTGKLSKSPNSRPALASMRTNSPCQRILATPT